MEAGNCIKSLQVDIDLPYKFVKDHFTTYLHIAREVLYVFGYRDILVKLKKSRSGFAHVVFVLDKCVDPRDYHVLMWLLTDHHDRIRHSMNRYEITGKILDFLYNNKKKNKNKK